MIGAVMVPYYYSKGVFIMAKKNTQSAKTTQVDPKVVEAQVKAAEAFNDLQLKIGILAGLKHDGASMLDIEVAEQDCNQALDEANRAEEAAFYTTSAFEDDPIRAFLVDPYVKRYSLKTTKDPYFGETLNITTSKRKGSLGTLEGYVDDAGKTFSTSPRWKRSFGNVYARLVARRALFFGAENVNMSELPDQIRTAAQAFMATPEDCTYAKAQENLASVVGYLMGDEVAASVGEAEVAYLDGCLTRAGKEFNALDFSKTDTLADEITSVLRKVTGIVTSYKFR